MDRTEAVAGVAGELYATELAVDSAIAHATALVQSMISARAELSISAVAGSGSQTRAIEAIAALSSAREAVVACHAELQKDHRRMGWGTYAAGPVNKPNEWDETPMGSNGVTSKGSHLRVA